MAAHRLDPLLRPASIAVVGASARPGTVGNEVLVNLRQAGYRGAVYPVNPAGGAIEGLDCYRSLGELPAVPQQVVFAVNDARLEACLEEAIGLGVAAATVFSALQPAGDTAPPLRERVRQRAAAAGLLLHGGNCMGFVNPEDRVCVSGFDARVHRPGGGVVLLSQSGAGMSGITDCEERLRFSLAASTGQELGVAMEDYLEFALSRPSTRVIGLFLETSRHPARFVAALAEARRRRIPVVALKVGRTALAAELAVSHSGALAGSDAGYQAVFEHHGVQRVEDMAQLAAALMMFSQPQPVAAGGLVCLHDSGGERQLAIDLAQSLAVPMTPLAPPTVAALAQRLDPGLPAVNPLDAWGPGGAAVMRDCFVALLRDPGAALGAVVHDRAVGGGIYPSYLDYLRAARDATGKPVFLVANHGGSGGDVLLAEAAAEGLVAVDGLREFLVGARCLLAYRDHLARDRDVLPQTPAAAVVAGWRRRLLAGEVQGERVAGDLLRDFGLDMAACCEADSARELAQQAAALRFPVVLKTAMPGIAHKTEVGGVIPGLTDLPALLAAYADLCARLGPRVLVASMVGGDRRDAGVEMLLGITRDAQFGPLVVVGCGGIHAEALADTVTLLPPFGAATARRALDRLRLRPLLDARRGRPALALDRFCDMAARLSLLAVALGDCIAELDVNPVKLLPDRCTGLDALVVAAKLDTGDDQWATAADRYMSALAQPQASTGSDG